MSWWSNPIDLALIFGGGTIVLVAIAMIVERRIAAEGARRQREDRP